MIETLEAPSSAPQTDSSVASVKLQDIFFASELWQPLYPTLFDYGAAPSGLNLVPSFQVKDSTITSVEVTLELRRDQDFELQSDQPVFWRMINGQATVTPSSVTSKSCVLTIKPATVEVVLQVLCKRTGQTDFSGREEIEGGLFLSIVNDPGADVEPGASHRLTDPAAGEILILGVDEHKRLRYNIFVSRVYTDLSMVSAGLEPEPAFRVRQAAPLKVEVSLNPTALIFIPKAGQPGEVALLMREPGTAPGALNVTFLTKDGGPVPEGCEIRWTSPGDPERLDYLVTSFSMEVRELTSEAKSYLQERGWDGKLGLELLMLLAVLLADSEIRKELLRKLLRVGGADPTIIDTPICTRINGATVCSD